MAKREILKAEEMSSGFLDSRNRAAKYYDLHPNFPDDVPFYINLLPSPDAHVLELGCGTGRVLIPISKACGYVLGLDSSEGMLGICQEKLREGGIPSSATEARLADITDFDLGRRFDLIIAPFRVFQNLESDQAVERMFRCIRKHLSPNGTSILNAFNPKRPRQQLLSDWVSEDEDFVWEVKIDGRRLTRHDRRSGLDADNMVLHPEFIYRLYDGDSLLDETVFEAALRVYYPQEFLRLVEDNGFAVLDRWGGYSNEVYGEGPELVVQFTDDA